MNHTEMFRNDLADAARAAVQPLPVIVVSIRVATSGHQFGCHNACGGTVLPADPYYRISFDGITYLSYCPKCGIQYDPESKLMAAWQTEQAQRATEAHKSERRLSARERSMRRKLHSEWHEMID